jgi:WD40 repeat protein
MVLVETYAVTVCADGSVVAFNDYGDEVVRLWTARGVKKGEIKTKGTGWCVLSADGRALAIRSEGNEVHLWETATGKPGRSFPGALPLGFSRDGRWLAVEDVSRDSLSVYDVATGKRALRVPFIGSAPPVAFSPDGRSLAVPLADTTIALHDLMPPAKKADER